MLDDRSCEFLTTELARQDRGPGCLDGDNGGTVCDAKRQECIECRGRKTRPWNVGF